MPPDAELLADGDAHLLAEGRAAFDRSDWSAAFAAFRAANAIEPLAVDDLERAALAAAWIGEGDAAVEYRQRAFCAHVADGENGRAAGAAINRCYEHAPHHREAVAIGWAQQAERLLEGLEPCSQLG